MVNYTPNGLPSPAPGEQADGPDAFQDLAIAVDAAYGGKVDNAGVLPTAGTFPGQRIWMLDVRAFAVWTGSAWAVPLDVELAASGNTSLTGTSLIDIAGLTYTVTSTGTTDIFDVIVTVDMRPSTSTPGTDIRLMVDGVARPSTIALIAGAGTGFTMSGTWKVTGLTAGSHVIKAAGQNFATATVITTGNSKMNIARRMP